MIFPATAGGVTTAATAAVRCSRRMRGDMLDRRARCGVRCRVLRSCTMLSRRRVLSGMLDARCGSVMFSRRGAMRGHMGLGMLGPTSRSRMMGSDFIPANGNRSGGAGTGGPRRYDAFTAELTGTGCCGHRWLAVIGRRGHPRIGVRRFGMVRLRRGRLPMLFMRGGFLFRRGPGVGTASAI
jgi:hypothetical protein